MTEPEDIARIRATQAETFGAQEAQARAAAAWLRAWGAPLWISDAFAAGADWWRARKEEVERDG